MRASMNAFEDRGYAVVPEVLDARQCEVLAGEIEGAGRDRSGSHNLLNLPRCQQLAVSLKAHAGIAAFLEAATVAVQCALPERSTAELACRLAPGPQHSCRGAHLAPRAGTGFPSASLSAWRRPWGPYSRQRRQPSSAKTLLQCSREPRAGKRAERQAESLSIHCGGNAGV